MVRHQALRLWYHREFGSLTHRGHVILNFAPGIRDVSVPLSCSTSSNAFFQSCQHALRECACLGWLDNRFLPWHDLTIWIVGRWRLQVAFAEALIKGLLVRYRHPAVTAITCKISPSNATILSAMLLSSKIASWHKVTTWAHLWLHQYLWLLLERC